MDFLAEIFEIREEMVQRQSRSKRANLLVPVARIERMLRQHRCAERIGGEAPVYLAAAVEYLIMDILNSADTEVRRSKAKTITTRHLNLAIRQNSSWNTIMQKGIVRGGGVLPADRRHN